MSWLSSASRSKSGPLEALLVAADRPVSEESGGVVADVPADLKSQVVTGASVKESTSPDVCAK